MKNRPAPLVVRVANCASVSTHPDKARDTFLRALHTSGRYGPPDVVLCQEMSDVDAAALAGSRWIVSQVGPIGSPSSGLAIALRRPRVHRLSSTLLDGTPATHEGGGIRRRPILVDRIVVDRRTVHSWRLRVASGHAAPGRAPHARARFLHVFEQLRIRVRGGDLNVAGRVAARLFARRVYSIGVLHLVVSRWIPAVGPAPVDHGSDHPGVDVLLWPSSRGDVRGN